MSFKFKMLILGAEGYLAQAIDFYFQEDYEVKLLSRTDCPIDSDTAVFQAVEKFDPDIITHCVRDPLLVTDRQTQQAFYETNLVGTLNVVNAAQHVDAEIVYFTYPLPTPLLPEERHSACRPLCMMPCDLHSAQVKDKSEKFIKSSGLPHYILRTGILFGSSGPKVSVSPWLKALMHLILANETLDVSDSCMLQPLSIGEFLRALKYCLKIRLHGTYDVMGTDVIAYNELVQLTVDILQLKIKIRETSDDQFYKLIQETSSTNLLSTKGLVLKPWRSKYKQHLLSLQKAGVIDRWRDIIKKGNI